MTELALQKFAVTLLRFNAAPGVIAFAIPNGEARSARTGAKLKAMGVLAGVADMAVIMPGGSARFLELKTPKGRLSDTQKAFRDRCAASGVAYETATTPEEVEAVLRGWGALKMQRPIPVATRKAA